jgi:hypothetical protein
MRRKRMICDNCGQQFQTGASFEWKAGNKIEEKLVAVQDRTSIYEKTYRDFLSITTAICLGCFDELEEKRLKERRMMSWGMLGGGILFLAFGVYGLVSRIQSGPDIGGPFLLATVSGALFTIAGFCSVIEKEEKDLITDQDRVKSHLRPFAEEKMRASGRDTLWTLEGFSKLRVYYR